MTQAFHGAPNGRPRQRRKRSAPSAAPSARRPEIPVPTAAAPPPGREREPDREPHRDPAPIDRAKSFASFGLAPEIARGVIEAGFLEPRPIQVAAIPSALAGRDVLGLAQTGTGKTAAFALPILERLHTTRGRGGRGPRALVVAPTRELARQIHDEIELLGVHTRVGSTTVFGGVPQGPQVRALKQGPGVVVACPGRLLDLVEQRAVDLSQVEVLVLDEADHMFDMGFLPHVRRILRLLPPKRQNLLFSATMPPEIRRLADEVLRDPLVVELSNSRPAETIAHALYEVAQPRRLELLQRLLAADEFHSAIVFLRTKHRARRIATQLAALGYRAIALQGNMSQGQRERAMEGFRRGTYDVLVATDIAARGIDVADVSHVVNFDVPNTPEAYTHRIGRTGRSERSGKAYTFAAREDDDQVRAIERLLGEPIPRRTLPGFDVGDLRASGAEKLQRGPRGGASPRARRPADAPRGGGGSRSSSGPRARSGGAGAGRPTAFPRPTGARATSAPPARPSYAFGASIDDDASPRRRREAK